MLKALVCLEKWQSRIPEANSWILEALREHWGVLKAVFFPEKWQSRILEGLHRVIAYPHGYLVHGYCIAHGHCVPTRLLGARLLTEDIVVALYQLYDFLDFHATLYSHCLLYTSPSPRDATLSRMPSSA